LKRWVGVAVAGLAAVCGAVTPRTAMASSGEWYQTYQVNTSATFSDIAAIGKTNVWAVGDLFDKKGNTIYQPFIRHYNGGGWKGVTIPGSPKFESDWVEAPAANDVWVGGLGNSSAANSMVYRFDGSHWQISGSSVQKPLRPLADAECSVREQGNSGAGIQLGRELDVRLPAFLDEFAARTALGKGLRQVVRCFTEGGNRCPRFR
jgi:hypothetical protein